MKKVCVWTLIGSVVVCAMLNESRIAIADDSLSFFDDRLSIGGESRQRVEILSDFYNNTGSSDVKDERLLLRNKIHLDYTPDDVWSVFVEGQDARQFGSDLIRRNPAFEDDIDLFQAYVEGKNIAGSPFSLKVGRQLFIYGKQRLIGAFLWSNTGRSFDAVKASVDIENLGGTIDVFAGQPVEHVWGEFNDIWGNQDTLYGAYSTWNQIQYLDFLEAYYLLKDVDNADTEVHTLGIRLGNNYDSGWDWEGEFMGQFGDFNGLDHTAFAMSINAGYTFEEVPWSPRTALGYHFSPGDDDPTDGDHETFDNLYPTNHIHYGQMDLISLRNIHDIELEATAKPMEKVTAKFETHFFILDEPENDNWYNAGGGVVRAGAPGADNYLGTEIDFHVKYTPSIWFAVEAGYSHFFAGEFVDDTGDDDDADWGYIQTTITF